MSGPSGVHKTGKAFIGGYLDAGLVAAVEVAIDVKGGGYTDAVEIGAVEFCRRAGILDSTGHVVPEYAERVSKNKDQIVAENELKKEKRNERKRKS